MKFTAALACVAAAAGWVQLAAAQTAPSSAGANWPERPVRIVVPFPPGGSSDFAARILTLHLQKTIKQTIVIDNRGGAGGNIGSEIVAKAAPDGYTFLITPKAPSRSARACTRSWDTARAGISPPSRQ